MPHDQAYKKIPRIFMVKEVLRFCRALHVSFSEVFKKMFNGSEMNFPLYIIIAKIKTKINKTPLVYLFKKNTLLNGF